MPETIKLKRREEVAAGTMAFHFEKPSGFAFTAGQAGEFTLLNPPEEDAEGNKRAFSLASAPYEADLMIATRMRDTAFKRSLKEMPLGSELLMDAPWGELVLHEDTRVPAVFLTGGIGITPVRSIVLQATREGRPQKLALFYSNRHPRDAAFLDELMQAQKTNHNFIFVPTMTQPEESSTGWKGETGFINDAMLHRHLNDLTRPVYYISGPPLMVSAMQKLLRDAGVNDPNIRVEEFSGY